MHLVNLQAPWMVSFILYPLKIDLYLFHILNRFFIQLCSLEISPCMQPEIKSLYGMNKPRGG